MRSSLSHSLAIACLTYPILAFAKGVHIKTGSSSHTCYDVNNHVIDCPKKPLTIGQIIAAVIAVIFIVGVVVAAIFIKMRKKNAANKYQPLPVPVSQPQATFIPPPQTSYNPPPHPMYNPQPPTTYSHAPQPYGAPPQVQFIPPPQASYGAPSGAPMHY